MALNPNACYGQPKYVEAPSGLALPYGLFSVSEIREGGDAHWQQGIEWERELCGPASNYGCPTCTLSNINQAPAKIYTDLGVPLESALPFTVYASFSCSPIGNWDRAEDRARAALLSGEERAVEAMLADGTHATSRALTNASSVDATPTPGTPVTIAQGLAILEEYIGLNGKGQGVIVGNRRDILLANTNGKLITREGDHLETIVGTPVAALSGFDGRTGPNNDAAGTGEAWLFGLGSRPLILRSDSFLTSAREQSLDTGTNDLDVLAERTYALGWDCFTVAVLVQSVEA